MQKTIVLIVLVVVVAGLIGWVGWYASQSGQGSRLATGNGQAQTQAPQQQEQQTGTQPQTQSRTKTAKPTISMGLQIKDIVVGTGTVAKAGDMVTVQYTGTFDDGTKFDSSYDHGEPFTFPLGKAQVIKGWDEGVAGMKVGGTRELVVPPDLGYGAAGRPPIIPPSATLHFTVQLLSVSAGS